tara:strand:+ start:237 stop:860 length:624 start_codon:yes stop_codon:yes gene_type:complete
MQLSNVFKKKYTFDVLAEDIIAVLNKEKIKSSHFVGISLGTILIRQIGEMYPKRVQSMVMAGAIMKLNVRSQILMRFGNVCKSIIPYLWLYRLFAYIIMPKKSHKESRLLFVREAKKLYQKEFLRWYKLTAELKPLLRLFRQVDINIPTLYVMGSEDYMFLPSIEKLASAHRSAQLCIVHKSGHVVNVDQPDAFNFRSISFIKKLNS